MSEGMVIGVVLAGGGGRRLGGVAKATLKIGGRRLIDRAVEALHGTAPPILVSIGDQSPLRFDSLGDVLLTSDIPFPGAGPVGGLAGAVACALDELPEPEFLLSLAVDTPFFPTDFAARALPLLTPSCPAVVAAYRGQIYPTNALWRLDALSELPRNASEGATNGGLKHLLADLGDYRLLDYGDAPDNPFSNVNTLTDLLACTRRAAGEAPAARTVPNE